MIKKTVLAMGLQRCVLELGSTDLKGALGNARDSSANRTEGQKSIPGTQQEEAGQRAPQLAVLSPKRPVLGPVTGPLPGGD